MSDEASSQRSFYIRQEGGEVQGPFPAVKIRRWLHSGKLRPKMSISEDRESWVRCTGALGLVDARIEVERLPEEKRMARSWSRSVLMGLLVGAPLGVPFFFLGRGCAPAAEKDTPEAPVRLTRSSPASPAQFAGTVLTPTDETKVLDFRGARVTNLAGWMNRTKFGMVLPAPLSTYVVKRGDRLGVLRTQTIRTGNHGGVPMFAEIHFVRILTGHSRDKEGYVFDDECVMHFPR